MSERRSESRVEEQSNKIQKLNSRSCLKFWKRKCQSGNCFQNAPGPLGITEKLKQLKTVRALNLSVEEFVAMGRNRFDKVFEVVCFVMKLGKH